MTKVRIGFSTIQGRGVISLVHFRTGEVIGDNPLDEKVFRSNGCNHSCVATINKSWWRDRILIAVRDIYPGDEITLPYARRFRANVTPGQNPCLCPKCRLDRVVRRK